MTIEQVEKRINHLCENEPDNIAGIRYWVGYRDALVSVKPMIDELNYNHDRLHDWDRGMTEKLEAAIAGQETLQKELAKYTTAEAEGRLLVLPCKVGDTVYQVIRAKDGGGHIRQANVGGLHLSDTIRNRRFKKENEYIVLRVDGGFCAHIDTKLIGKTVFLTREEAEAALAKENT